MRDRLLLLLLLLPPLLLFIDRINLKHAALEMGTSVVEGIGFVGFLLRAPTPSQVRPDQWPEWLTTRWHAGNVTAISLCNRVSDSGRVVLWGLGQRHDSTRRSWLSGQSGLTLELRHAVLLESASVRPSRLWPLFPVVLPLNLKPITVVLPLCSLDLSPSPGLLPRYYRGTEYRVVLYFADGDRQTELNQTAKRWSGGW